MKITRIKHDGEVRGATYFGSINYNTDKSDNKKSVADEKMQRSGALTQHKVQVNVQRKTVVTA